MIEMFYLMDFTYSIHLFSRRLSRRRRRTKMRKQRKVKRRNKTNLTKFVYICV